MKKSAQPALQGRRASITGACLGLLVFSTGLQGAQAKMPLVKFGSNTVKLEVASTQKEIEQGLMYRTSLPEDQGMVFLFRPAQAVNFWMAHCFISLDMIMIKDGKIIKIFENVPPCRAQNLHDCPQYPEGAGLEVTEVVEVIGGYSKRHNVKVGDAATFELPEKESH
jgi:uncharacterized membrane protein (UPF0127 family)